MLQQEKQGQMTPPIKSILYRNQRDLWKNIRIVLFLKSIKILFIVLRIESKYFNTKYKALVIWLPQICRFNPNSPDKFWFPRHLYVCWVASVCVQFCATPWLVACQAPLSMGFSRQEHWGGLPCPPPGESSWPRHRTCVSFISCIGKWVLYH